jgi:hypothetical protein
MKVKDFSRRASKLVGERRQHLRQRGTSMLERMRRRRGH